MAYKPLFWKLLQGHSSNVETVPTLDSLTLNQRVQGSSPCAPTN
jgi:hypothetical protein